MLTDEGIGPKLVNKLKVSFPHEDIQYDTACVGGLEILNYIHGYDEVIFIDAIKTRKGNPGDVYFFSPDNYKETLHLSNVYDLSFLTALKLGNKLGYPMPETILIIAIEVENEWVFGDELTATIKERYDEIFDTVYQRIKSELKSNDN